MYLGLGLFFTDFFPYFLHLNPSSMISTSDFVLNATQDPPSLLRCSDAPLLCFEEKVQSHAKETSTQRTQQNSFTYLVLLPLPQLLLLLLSTCPAVADTGAS